MLPESSSCGSTSIQKDSDIRGSSSWVRASVLGPARVFLPPEIFSVMLSRTDSGNNTHVAKVNVSLCLCFSFSKRGYFYFRNILCSLKYLEMQKVRERKSQIVFANTALGNMSVVFLLGFSAGTWNCLSYKTIDTPQRQILAQPLAVSVFPQRYLHKHSS